MNYVFVVESNTYNRYSEKYANYHLKLAYLSEYKLDNYFKTRQYVKIVVHTIVPIDVYDLEHDQQMMLILIDHYQLSMIFVDHHDQYDVVQLVTIL